MAKKQKYLGMEVKKKGNGLFVECALLIDAGSRKEAQNILEDYDVMKPIVVLTEKEAHEMLKKLTHMLLPGNFGKKEERLLWKRLEAIETRRQKMEQR
jgi:hypothetical protein